jgi:hypothetical protein
MRNRAQVQTSSSALGEALRATSWAACVRAGRAFGRLRAGSPDSRRDAGAIHVMWRMVGSILVGP